MFFLKVKHGCSSGVGTLCLSAWHYLSLTLHARFVCFVFYYILSILKICTVHSKFLLKILVAFLMQLCIFCVICQVVIKMTAFLYSRNVFILYVCILSICCFCFQPASFALWHDHNAAHPGDAGYEWGCHARDSSRHDPGTGIQTAKWYEQYVPGWEASWSLPRCKCCLPKSGTAELLGTVSSPWTAWCCLVWSVLSTSNLPTCVQSISTAEVHGVCRIPRI
jgi:hypothetical protein